MESEAPLQSTTLDKSGINGWLVVWIIWVIGMFLYIAQHALLLLSIYVADLSWGPFYFSPIIIIVFMCVAILALGIYNFILFFKNKKSFILMNLIWLWVVCLLAVGYYIWLAFIYHDVIFGMLITYAAHFIFLPLVVIPSILWIIYFYRSERVKKTFVK